MSLIAIVLSQYSAFTDGKYKKIPEMLCSGGQNTANLHFPLPASKNDE